MWGGEETPCALGAVSCIVKNYQEPYTTYEENNDKNRALTEAICELLEPFGVSSDKIYLNVCQPRRPRYRPHPPACMPYLHLARVTSRRGCCW